MPFPTPLSTPQQTTLRTSGYWSRNLVALNPNEVVFRAQASESIVTAPFISFGYDNVDVGTYTDVWEGMVAYISATPDVRDAKYRGRVRLAPDANTFNIDENATILNDGDYIIVTRDVDLFARVRRDTLVDGAIAYHNLPPVTDGLPSVLVLYDADNDGLVNYTSVQTGIAVADSATVVLWAWDISGVGTSSIDDPTLQNPTFTFEVGFHYLLRVIFEDDNGVANYQIVQIYAIDRTFGTPIVQPVVAGSIEAAVDDGYTSSLTAYADVDALIDRTHCVVFHVEHFGDNSSTPIVNNVLMTGRIRSDSIQTRGTVEAGQVQQVTFAVEGIGAYLQRLRIPNDIVRAVAVPDEWGEMVNPNPFRMTVYAMWAYTTLTNIGSMGVETGAFDAWRVGGEPREIEGGYALDVLENLLDPIKAAVNFAPSGELFLGRIVSYLADRSGIATILTAGLQDMREYTLDRDSSRTCAQVIAFGGVYQSASNTFDIYTAQSPSIVYGDAGETLELNREILTAESSSTDAANELAIRGSNHYAYSNPKPLLRISFYDSYVGVLVPAVYYRYAFDLPASSNTLGIGYSASDYWQCQSVSITLNTDGSIDVSAQFPAETEFDDAQVMAALLPNNLSGLNPILPVLPNDPAFPTDPLELYPTDTPTLDELQPINPFSLSQTQTPFQPNVSADMASKQGNAKCQTVAINFRNPNNTVSNKVTALSADYLIKVSGTTEYSDDAWEYFVHFSGGMQSWSPFMGLAIWQGTYWESDTFIPAYQTCEITRAIPALGASTITSIAWTGYLAGLRTDGFSAFGVDFDGTAYEATNPAVAPMNYGFSDTNIEFTPGFQPTTLTRLYTATTTNLTDKNTITSVRIRGTGVNPFTLAPGGMLNADAFYLFRSNDPEFQPTLLSSVEGLFLDNAKYAAVPPYSPNHVYTNLPFTGTGNLLLARMEFSDYTDKTNQNLYLELCRKS